MSLNFPISLTGKRASSLAFGNYSRTYDLNYNDYTTMGDVLDDVFHAEDAKFTLALWQKGTASSSEYDVGTFIAKYSPDENYKNFTLFGRSNNNTVRFRFDAATGGGNAVFNTSVTCFSPTQWNHIAVEYDGTQPLPANRVKIYVNGVEDTGLITVRAHTNDVPIKNTNTELTLGATKSFNRESFFHLDGSLADVRVYDDNIGASAIAGIAEGIHYSSSLVGWWLTDSDDLLDHSANSNNGINANNSTFQNSISPNKNYGQSGQSSRGFSDANNYGSVSIRKSGTFPISGPQTWAAWVRYQDVAGIRDLFGQWNGDNNNRSIGFVKGSDNKIYFQVSSSGNTAVNTPSTTSMYINDWIHVAGVYEPSTSIKIYINGSLENTNTTNIPASLYNTNTRICIGSRNGSQYLHDGQICDCRIYDAALDATTISNLWSGTDYTTNLIGHWLGNSNSLRDMVGDNHIGAYFSTDGPLV